MGELVHVLMHARLGGELPQALHVLRHTLLNHPADAPFSTNVASSVQYCVLSTQFFRPAGAPFNVSMSSSHEDGDEGPEDEEQPEHVHEATPFVVL